MFDKVFEKRDSKSDEINWCNYLEDKFVGGTKKNKDIYYNRCINILSENIAKIPFIVQKNGKNGREEDEKFYLNNILRLRPNSSMTSFELFRSFVAIAKDKGIAGIYIQRQKGKVVGLYPCEINGITIDDRSILANGDNKVAIDFSINNVCYDCLEKDMIIYRDNPVGGIWEGKSSDSYIKNIINSNVSATEYQSKLFSNNLTGKIAVQLSSDIKEESELRKIKNKFNRLLQSDEQEARDNVFTIPLGYQIVPLNVNLADSQFAELKLQGKQDICNAIGVPIKLIDGTMTDEEFNTFLSIVCEPFLIQLQQELNYKLLTETERNRGYVIRYNTSAVLKTSLKKQQEILCEYHKNGIYTTNMVLDILGMQHVEGGDKRFVPSGTALFSDLLNGNASWQKNTNNNNNNVKGGDIEDGEAEGNEEDISE